MPETCRLSDGNCCDSPDIGSHCDRVKRKYVASMAVSCAIEAIERRLLLSAYTPTALAYFGTVPINGTNPVAALTSDSAGNLYGTTEYGGASNLGTVFEIPKSSMALTTIVSFTPATGGNPCQHDGDRLNRRPVRHDHECGPTGSGSIYEISAGSNAITVLASSGTSTPDSH